MKYLNVSVLFFTKMKNPKYQFVCAFMILALGIIASVFFVDFSITMFPLELFYIPIFIVEVLSACLYKYYYQKGWKGIRLKLLFAYSWLNPLVLLMYALNTMYDLQVILPIVIGGFMILYWLIKIALFSSLAIHLLILLFRRKQ